jgi:hypothetical protein
VNGRKGSVRNTKSGYCLLTLKKHNWHCAPVSQKINATLGGWDKTYWQKIHPYPATLALSTDKAKQRLAQKRIFVLKPAKKTQRRPSSPILGHDRAKSGLLCMAPPVLCPGHRNAAGQPQKPPEPSQVATANCPWPRNPQNPRDPSTPAYQKRLAQKNISSALDILKNLANFTGVKAGPDLAKFGAINQQGCGRNRR